DQGLRNDAAKDLPVPVAVGADHFPSLASLLEMPGDNKKGEAAFARATCNTCHRIAGQGVDFGPDLSEIGKKLPREGLVEAILYPSAAISHGFQGVAITTKSGEQLVGYVTGETAGDLQLRLPGGVAKSVDRAEVAKRTELDQSLMPPGLAAILGPEDLMHLVSYLQTLK
ncbi:MAG TPA: c-type cytochrome, partial [Verrucomicrobiales bacterium]|nr:c-type cytochrome [Verrucomicrobiales bacterium]